VLQEDVSLAGYRKHLEHQASSNPLTAAEEELEFIKQTEVAHLNIWGEVAHLNIKGEVVHLNIGGGGSP